MAFRCVRALCVSALIFSLLALASACEPQPVRRDAGGRDGSATLDGDQPDDCLTPRTQCGSQCVDTASDPRHCGMCDNRCPAGGFCANSDCAASCSPPLTACGESCVDLASSSAHCGDCNRPCSADRMCSSGSCVCATGLSECGESCVDRQSSNSHCGRCDNPCGEFEMCVMGTCQPTRELDCMGDMDTDGDGLTNCADPDCEGADRPCTCPVGMAGDNPSELCTGTAWGECGPCGPAPACDASNPCDYGWNCVSNECVFDPTTRFDMILIDAIIPLPASGDWDAFGGLPDVAALISVGSYSPWRSTEISDLHPIWNERVIRPATAADFLARTRIEMIDVDVSSDDLIGSCDITWAERSFDGSMRSITCPPTATAPGWRAHFQFVEPN